MAKIKFSVAISDARGKVGGNVFSRNKAGAYLRTFVKPTNPSTPAQQVIRNRVQSLVTSWRALTDPIRLAWNNAAQNFPQTNKMGETFYLTGQQLFTKFNSNLLAGGEAVSSAAPMNSTQSVIAITDLTVSTGVFDVTIDVATIPATTFVTARATDGISAGRSNAFRSQYRQVGEAPTAAANVIDLATDFEAVFGAISGKVGQKVFVEILTVDIVSGQIVGKSKISTIIA